MAGPEGPLPAAPFNDGGAASPPASDPRVGSATLHFDDIDSFAAAIGGADVVYVPVHPGSFRAELTQIQLGRVIIQLGRDSPHLSRDVAGEGRMGILLSQHGPDGTIFNSRMIGPDDLLMMRPGSPLDSTVAVEDAWAHLTLPEDDDEALAEAWGVPFRGADRYRFLPGEASSLAPLRQCIRRAAQFVAAHPGHVAAKGFAASLTDRLEGHVGALLAGAGFWEGPTRQTGLSITKGATTPLPRMTFAQNTAFTAEMFAAAAGRLRRGRALRPRSPRKRIGLWEAQRLDASCAMQRDRIATASASKCPPRQVINSCRAASGASGVR